MMYIPAVSNLESALPTAVAVSQAYDKDPMPYSLYHEAVNSVEKVNNVINTANQLGQKVALGEDIPTHELMIAYESAKLKLTMLVEVRNKIVESYHELMRIQV